MTELEELLAADPQAAKCYRCLSGQDEMTIDGLAACYGNEPESPAEVIARVTGATDAQAQAALSLSSPVSADPALVDADAERIWQAWSARMGLTVDDEPAADPELEWGVW